jgi:hypothetical protein
MSSDVLTAGDVFSEPDDSAVDSTSARLTYEPRVGRRQLPIRQIGGGVYY